MHESTCSYKNLEPMHAGNSYIAAHTQVIMLIEHTLALDHSVRVGLVAIALALKQQFPSKLNSLAYLTSA